MALSDLLGPALQIGSTILNVGAQLSKASATRAIGARRQAASQFEAEQFKQAAELASGVGLRAAQDQTIQARLVNSTALARAAASGAGASDPTVMNILARTGAEGAYRSAVAMYQGEAQARMDRLRAAAAQYEGATVASDSKAASRISEMGAASTILSGGVRALTMYERFFPQDMVKNPSGLEAGTNGGWIDAGSEAGGYA